MQQVLIDCINSAVGQQSRQRKFAKSFEYPRIANVARNMKSEDRDRYNFNIFNFDLFNIMDLETLTRCKLYRL